MKEHRDFSQLNAQIVAEYCKDPDICNQRASGASWCTDAGLIEWAQQQFDNKVHLSPHYPAELRKLLLLRFGPEEKKCVLTVVPCYRNYEGEWQIDSLQGISIDVVQGDISHHSRGTYLSLHTLLRRAKLFCKPGLAVIVRPCFNDLQNADGKIIGFREWRSFDGGPLEEVKFPDYAHKDG